MESPEIIYIPPISLVGPGALNDLKNDLLLRKFKRTLFIPDPALVETGVAQKVEDILMECDLDYIVYEVHSQTPTTENVNVGCTAYTQNSCDCIIALGVGFPQDCGKAIGILATNGGRIEDFEGIHKSENKSAPIISINSATTNASEIAINYVVTDEKRKVKMEMVDKNCLVDIDVNDPLLLADELTL